MRRKRPTIDASVPQTAAWVRRDRGSAVPTQLDAIYDDAALDVVLELHIVVRRGAPELDELLARRRDVLRTPPVTSSALRSVPIAAIVRAVLDHVAQPIEDLGEGLYRLPGDAPDSARGGGRAPGRGRPMDDTHLEQVADVYRQAVKAGRHDPVNAVQEILHTSRSTAGRWVLQARAAGKLGPAVGTRAGEATKTTRRSKR